MNMRELGWKIRLLWKIWRSEEVSEFSNSTKISLANTSGFSLVLFKTLKKPAGAQPPYITLNVDPLPGPPFEK